MPLKQLKLATQAAHEATEAVAFSAELRNGSLTLDQYQQLLTKNWYIHQALEKALAATIQQITPNPFADFIDQKSNWLIEDFQHLAIDLPSSNLLMSPVFDSIAALTGGLYVIEGSMLGGQYIVKQLHQQEAFEGLSDFRFYTGYGAKTGKRWQTFRQKATSILQDPAAIKVAINSAQETFNFFQTVYEKK